LSLGLLFDTGTAEGMISLSAAQDCQVGRHIDEATLAFHQSPSFAMFLFDGPLRISQF